MKHINKPLRIAIILAFALIVIALVVIGIRHGRSLGVYEGMSREDYADRISSEDRFDYLSFSFYENWFGTPVVVRFDDEGKEIEDVEILSKRDIDKSAKSFAEIQKGMDLYDVVAKVGTPTKSVTFGMISTIFEANDGTEYCIYWSESADRDTLIVTSIEVDT